ncbi:MAG: GTP 3',8-cyclase MoaA, partial [Methanobacterium sp.]|nr:GTP 3',8-cyclase MoaA [Methanobacterium sp.]
MKTTDRYQRPIISLRISITNRCNVKCFYCHHDGIVARDYEMTSEEIYKVCKIAKEIGIDKIRLSGGEPLIRDDIVDIVKKISTLNFKDISITTNGILLGKYANELVKAGLNRINVSFDTLNPVTYKFITKHNYMENAKAGIKKAVEAGFNPVKVNMVIMKGINHGEICKMFKFCRKHGVVLQLIELLKTENCEESDFLEKYHYNMEPLEEELNKISSKVKIRPFMQDRKKYFIDGGEIEMVRPMDNTQFC